ncbi:YceI family protein [Jannaschia formosa]|uniref:YceI family protein n=1 Tax=Jannaschia formosa TaxID=2259592 RepID=UPI000E1C0A94|nr:YceI family protein [Jannaschia formosa]TFL18378.1 polyisoprenoid-binding protein [Jannaschia formosa]
MRPLLAALPFLVASTAALAEPARYELDPEHTTVSFLVSHVGYAATLGFFTEVSGGFVYDAETQELGEVEVRVNLPSLETFNDARDNHVRSGDFLDAEAHPEMVFTASGGTPTGETTGTVEGELTLRGETRPLTLDVTLNKAEEYPFGHRRFTLGLTVRGTLNRSDWGMTYGVENGLVGDEVSLIIETEAMRVE